MKKFFIRSLLFNLYIILTTFFIATLFLPGLIFSKNVDYVGRLWGQVIKWGMEKICRIKISIRGQEHLPDKPYIIAAKHQSMAETVIFWLLLSKPTFVLKKELTKIPLYGLYLIKMGMIVIDRKKSRTSLEQILTQSKKTFESNGVVVIFPEGTRTKPYQPKNYKRGIVALYTAANLPVVPIAVNSGLLWPSKTFWKFPGNLIMQILPPINPGLDKEVFYNQLQDMIEIATNSLFEESKTSQN